MSTPPLANVDNLVIHPGTTYRREWEDGVVWVRVEPQDGTVRAARLASFATVAVLGLAALLAQSDGLCLFSTGMLVVLVAMMAFARYGASRIRVDSRGVLLEEIEVSSAESLGRALRTPARSSTRLSWDEIEGVNRKGGQEALRCRDGRTLALPGGSEVSERIRSLLAAREPLTVSHEAALAERQRLAPLVQDRERGTPE